jgi:hypothetical protein
MNFILATLIIISGQGVRYTETNISSEPTWSVTCELEGQRFLYEKINQEGVESVQYTCKELPSQLPYKELK